MTLETVPTHGNFLAHALEKTTGYAKVLLTDIEPDSFAHMPMPNFNHPAFCYGHLALYPNLWFDFLGRPEEKIEIPFDEALYQQGAECVEQDGRYASMEEITSTFFAVHKRALEVLPTVDASVFAQELPEGTRYRDFFGHVGNALTFMTGPHLMMHLGQVSMWRRAMGLGPCM